MKIRDQRKQWKMEKNNNHKHVGTKLEKQENRLIASSSFSFPPLVLIPHLNKYFDKISLSKC